MRVILALFSFWMATQAQAQYVGDKASLPDSSLGYRLQGLCSSSDFYFVTRRYDLWKIPKNLDFRNVNKRTPGVTILPLPSELKKLGFNHMGDCDVFKNVIYIPLEGLNQQKLLMLDTESLQVIAWPNFPNEMTDAAWISADSRDGSLVISAFNVTPETPLWRLKISDDLQSITTIDRMALKDENGNAISVPRIQAGEVVAGKNKLMILSDTPQTGLYGFNLETLRLENHFVIKYKTSKLFKQELEGLDAQDDSDTLFVAMLKQRLLGILGNGFYLKGFKY